MVNGNTLRRAITCASSYRTLALAIAGFGLAAGAPAFAQTANAPVNLDLGAVVSTGTGSAATLASTPGTAPYEAPSKAPLNASQPTSVVNQNAIQNLTNGTQSYADVMRLTPSVNTINPNGPGLMETDGPTIRGFQDGQYNLTFDGIPIGDSNDFTHHSTSFFTNDEIGQTIVDRGPGTAETVGDATSAARCRSAPSTPPRPQRSRPTASMAATIPASKGCGLTPVRSRTPTARPPCSMSST